jgi:predicted Zn-dependent protease
MESYILSHVALVLALAETILATLNLLQLSKSLPLHCKLQESGKRKGKSTKQKDTIN